MSLLLKQLLRISHLRKKLELANGLNQELGRAIREGIRPNGDITGPPMPIEFYKKYLIKI
jgi:hypothetical protein